MIWRVALSERLRVDPEHVAEVWPLDRTIAAVELIDAIENAEARKRAEMKAEHGAS